MSGLEVVREVWRRWSAGDISGILELMADDVCLDHRGPNGVPFNRVYEGREAVGEFFRVLNESQEATEFEIGEYFANEDRVVNLGSFRFKVHSTNKEWQSDVAFVFTVRNGKVTYWRPIFNMGAEAEAFLP